MLAWVIVATFVQTQPNAYSGQHEVYPQSQPKQQRTASGRLTIPLNSRLLGTASLGEIREFPEERQQSNIQRVVGVEATDQSYESDRSYGDVVAFFDREFQGGGFQLQERTVRPHSTLWTVKRPDGMLARVAVRNTTPTTFEVVEAAGEGGTVSVPPPGTNQPGAQPLTDREFVARAQQTNLAEIDEAKLALERSSSPQARQLAQKVLDDHQKAAQELTQLAQQQGYPLPTQPTAQERAEFDQLSRLTGQAFDRSYISDQMQDHQQAIRDFQTEAQTGQNAAIRDYARRTLPALEQHAQMAQPSGRSM